MNFTIGLVVYLLGCLIAQIMLDKLGIDREEWKLKNWRKQKMNKKIKIIKQE